MEMETVALQAFALQAFALQAFALQAFALQAFALQAFAYRHSPSCDECSSHSPASFRDCIAVGGWEAAEA
jgi:hypothetical protein